MKENYGYRCLLLVSFLISEVVVCRVKEGMRLKGKYNNDSITFYVIKEVLEEMIFL